MMNEVSPLTAMRWPPSLDLLLAWALGRARAGTAAGELKERNESVLVVMCEVVRGSYPDIQH